ncbi:BMP family ABC transporter substrate-binding protein [Bacteroides helcogenes]|uniref:Basic membrane lipoprotein n=1 Tax=Bacteroides helcogenes (strain ATCC 35417 / DSM 20613 / JCM 6297 / CCUG 15421 / P 36-108) TaxID=693979 RepID=E6SR75_BACT6|nr:BMP family ABC transporter substrate-binding protein [Bacteroides helcogenes]ADV43019.1 basic membrane lipoprotein [Bacteroides helcogenes P 36-108]MDY5236936.1 BMP family ABC transporter substrate-binding protein [Bacteroides helcogenes]
MRIFRCQSIIAVIGLGLMLVSCSHDADEFPANNLPCLTLITSTGGMGDNGYNDLIFDGIMEFATKNEVTLSIISPKDKLEAQTAVSDWCDENTDSKQSLLVLASSEYESLLDGNFSELKASKSILLFESERKDLPGNVFTFNIRRYGASFLCGRMAAECPQAFVLAACPSDATLQPAIDGFLQGYAKEEGRTADVSYLADDAIGFNSPEKAYLLTKELPWNAFVFPLAGGSNSGVYKYVRENMFSGMLIAGMDVDCSAYSTRTPFSLTLKIDRMLNTFLNDWLAGNTKEQHWEGGLAEGFADVTVNAAFFDKCLSWEDYYDSQDYWQKAYDTSYQEALEAERRYYEK